MKLILIKDVKDLGMAGDIITVKSGYGRNYLLPQKYAVMATKDALKKIEAIKVDADKARNAKLEENKAKLASISQMTLTFTRKADENGSLYGSVSEFDIVEAIKEKGLEINKNNVIIEKHIKEIGDSEVQVSFGSDLTATVVVTVVKEEI
ncbi:50S ribosomal protein L9 [bacterium]|nr:50S ribosomal protein L9 [bacterium]